MDNEVQNNQKEQQPNKSLEPHRGTMILVFGIIGIVLCGIFAILAWVFGNKDLQRMNEGVMDPSGRELTNIGKILGIIGVCLWALGIIVWIIMIIGMAGAAAI